MQSFSPLQTFVFYRTYSRWNNVLGRRETWEETVTRYLTYFKNKFESKVPKKVWLKAEENILAMRVMPSMRALWSAGPALDATHVAGYNCCYLAFKDLFSPAELFYVLMCGTGVGFSVEKEFIKRMPTVIQQTSAGKGVYIIEDSKEGWANSLHLGLKTWFNGEDLEFDYSKIRPRGAPLKTMGGRASGPDPLKELHSTVRQIVLSAQGRQLSSLEWLDIGNKIADVVVVGGVRRSSEITFSDLEDEEIRSAKDFSKGPFPTWRYMSNNSAVYHGRPDMVTFMKEWTALAASGSGERGIFNSANTLNNAPRRKDIKHLRSNPCGEILLRDSQFCNLTEVVVRKGDTFNDLVEKVKTAVWLGAMQSCLVNFPYIRPEFRANCEEERLLGVSLTGQMDAPKLMSENRLQDLKDVAIAECVKATKALGINMSAAITTGKPSGTVSQLVDSASGAHPRFSKYYIRRVRISSIDPLCRMLQDQGMSMSPENGQGPEAFDIDNKQKEFMNRRTKMGLSKLSKSELEILVPDWTPMNVDTWVVNFPVKAPDGAITTVDVTAIEQLEWYKKIRTNWCEHNQSITIYVKDEEWLKVGNWVYENFDVISGVSFLPFNGGNYQQAPYEAITKKQYHEMVKAFPLLDYTRLAQYEMEDNTIGAQNLACMAGACELP